MGDRMTDEYRNLVTADEVDRYIPDSELEYALDWFPDGEPMPTDEYLDRLFPRHSRLADERGRTLDLDSLDNPAARRIMSRARRLRKERQT